MTPHVFLPLSRFVLSSFEAILLQELLDKIMSQISYLIPGIRGSLHIEFPHVLSHLLRIACQIHQSSKFPCDIAINVRSPSSRKFCTPSMSSIAGPFTKCSAPNVRNRASNSTIDTSTTAWRDSFLSDIEKARGKRSPRRTRSIRLLAPAACCQ